MDFFWAFRRLDFLKYEIGAFLKKYCFKSICNSSSRSSRQVKPNHRYLLLLARLGIPGAQALHVIWPSRYSLGASERAFHTVCYNIRIPDLFVMNDFVTKANVLLSPIFERFFPMNFYDFFTYAERV